MLKRWFYVDVNTGSIETIPGKHETFHDADECLFDNGIPSAVWVFDEDTAKEWLETLVKTFAH